MLNQSQHGDAGHVAGAGDQPGRNLDAVHLIVLSVIRGDLACPDVTNAPETPGRVAKHRRCQWNDHPRPGAQGVRGPCRPPAGGLERCVSGLVDRTLSIEDGVVNSPLSACMYKMKFSSRRALSREADPRGFHNL